MHHSLRSESGGRKTIRLTATLLAGGLGLALLPLTAHAQQGRASASTGQPTFHTQTGAPTQGFSPAPQMNRGEYSGPRMLPGNNYLQGGQMFPHYGLGFQHINPGVIYRRGNPPEQNNGLFGGPPAGQNFGLFGGPSVPQNYGLFGPNLPLAQEPARTYQHANGYIAPMQQTNRPGVSFSAGPPSGGNNGRHTVPYLPTTIINPAAHERYHVAGFYFRYNNGVYGRAHYCRYHGWYFSVFPDGLAYYPFYALDYLPGVTCPSPYAYYLDAFPPYISAGEVGYAPPQYGYVPAPTYTPDGAYQGYQPDDLDSYYLNRAANGNYRIGEQNPQSAEKPDDALKAAVDDIQKAWQERDIPLLVKHVRHDSQIAVYLRGKYQYSLDSGDYVDMTRDAFRATKTVSFALDGIQRKEDGVYVVTGRHVYKDKDGADHTVHVSYVLERADGDYYITQVGTDPDKAVSVKGDEDKSPKPTPPLGEASQPVNGQSNNGQPTGSGQTGGGQPDDGGSGQ